MPCGHGGICYDCAVDTWAQQYCCYLCKKKIDQILEIDLDRYTEGIIHVKTSTQLEDYLKAVLDQP